MAKNKGFTRIEALVLVVIVALLVSLACLSVPRWREEARRIRCRNQLNCTAKAMATYLNEFGNNTWYPCPLGRGLRPNDYSGAEWYATPRWVGLHTWFQCFLCPSSGDTNHEGLDLGTDRAIPGRFGSQTVSYAAMHYYSLTDEQGNPKPAALRDDFPPNEPMASDDTEGTVNHRGGMHVLFFDSHVEFRTSAEIDSEHGVGQKGGLLWRLRN
jgi:prepilin-type processing-associated H-X9-DG protein